MDAPTLPAPAPPAPMFDPVHAIPLPSTVSVVSVGAGLRHTVVGTVDGAVLVFGDRARGQWGVRTDLGLDPGRTPSTPGLVHALASKRIAKVRWEVWTKRREGDGNGRECGICL